MLRHLINTLSAEVCTINVELANLQTIVKKNLIKYDIYIFKDETALQRIALSLQDTLSEGNPRQMVGAIVALAARPSVPLLPSQRSSFVRYLVN